MLLNSAGFIIFFITLSECKKTHSDRRNVRKFPEGFMFGTSTAAYQIEGSWDADGKSENIWDHMTHADPCSTVDCSNGDIAADSYHQYKRDVEMMRELGIDFYRFSISWTRILPTGFPDHINKAGVQHYSDFIDEMLKYNIEPMVTLYHWDLPQRLQDLGGWANPHIADWFADYARVVFGLYGDRVKYWITINDPQAVCYEGYGSDTKAPRLNIKGVGEYMCAKNLLLAHAKAYHIYDQEFRSKYNGSIFISLKTQFFEPDHDCEIEAADISNQFEWGAWAHPIFSETGDFPNVFKEKIAAKSAEQGFFRSRLPELTPEEVEYVKGTSDFFGLNHYSTYLVYRNSNYDYDDDDDDDYDDDSSSSSSYDDDDESRDDMPSYCDAWRTNLVIRNRSGVGLYDIPSFYDDLGNIYYQPDHWEHGASSFFKVVPWGFYELLTKIRRDYNNPAVIITENGYSNHGGLDDDDRISYQRKYQSAMLDAIDEGSNIRGYSVWSLMDNFEWMQGYTERFGLYEVDFESPERTRTPRKSAFVYKQMLRKRALDWHYKPKNTVMTIDEGH